MTAADVPAEASVAVDAERTKAHVREALDQLPDDFRTAVTLCDLEGLSYKEIAAIMDSPLGTVMSRIYRGRKLLRELLDGQRPTRDGECEWAHVCCRGESYADAAKGAAVFRARLSAQGFTVVEVERGHMWIRLHASRAVAS